MRRLVGLDGLRALAVLSVVLFHLDYSLLPGGFLGVDVFFVISGFLITNLIATEILSTGRLRLGRFYLRRARRLLPTVLVLLAVVALASTTVWRDQLATLKGGVISSLAYVTNWWLIADHQSYFVATGRPTMLQHLWSLAIEEQFYLVWSVAVVLIAGAVTVVRRGADPVRRMRTVVGVAIALAVVSTALMAWNADREDLPYGGSTSRVYFGSDTHAMGLFLGSAAGAWLALRAASRAISRPPTPLVRVPTRRVSSRALHALTDLIGLAAVVVAVAQFVTIDEYSPGLYRGGFLAFDAAVLVAVLCAVRAGSLFGRVLDIRPVRWVGLRSYSIYIWHWPICVVTRPGLDVGGSIFWINVARLALILGLSALSYHFIEVPLRTGTLHAWVAERRAGRRMGWEFAAGVTTCLAALTLVVNSAPAGSVAPLAQRLKSTGSHLPSPSAQAPAHNQAPSGRQSAQPAGGTTTSPAAPLHVRTPRQIAVSAFGDSVLLGARSTLQRRTSHLTFDAVEGRQANDVLNDILADARAGTLQPYVLIHIGDNGIIKPDQLRATLQALSDRARVVLMTVRVPRDWQDPNNDIIRHVGASFPNVRIDDWASQSNGRTDWLYDDGIHLRAAGALAYSQIVLAALREP